jgi:hypothetical protein
VETRYELNALQLSMFLTLNQLIHDILTFILKMFKMLNPESIGLYPEVVYLPYKTFRMEKKQNALCIHYPANKSILALTFISFMYDSLDPVLYCIQQAN